MDPLIRATSKPATLLLLAAALAGCGRSGPAGGERIVSVSKQLNEYLYAIGATEHLVGRDLTSVYPPEIRKLTSVGYHRALSADGIISLRPTMFLTDGNVGPDAVLEQLRKVGIPTVELAPGDTPEAAQETMRELGRRFHHERQADSVIAAWRAGMARVLADTAEWAGKPRPRVLIMHFGQIVNNYLGIGRGGTAERILEWAGGENAIDSTGRMLRLTPELIAQVAPEVILATDVGFDRVGSAAAFAQLPGVSLTPAGKAGRVYRIDETEIMYYGPRTPQAVEHLAGLIHR